MKKLTKHWPSSSSCASNGMLSVSSDVWHTILPFDCLPRHKAAFVWSNRCKAKAYQLPDAWWRSAVDRLLSRCECLGETLLSRARVSVGTECVCPPSAGRFRFVRCDRSHGDAGT